MLTGKLVRVKYAKNKLVPQYIDPYNDALRALADQLLLAYRGAACRRASTRHPESP